LPFLQPDCVPNSGVAYGLSKRANHLRVQAASLTWGERGARVNSISPGIIATRMAQHEMASPIGGLGPRPRLHGHVGILRRDGRRRIRSRRSGARSTSASRSSTRPTCTAWAQNEELVGRAIAGRRDEVVLATKFGNVRGPNGEFLGVNGAPAYVLARVRGEPASDWASRRSISTTSTASIPKVPIEETVGAMSELVTAGKVRTSGSPRPRPRRFAAPTHASDRRATERSTRSGRAIVEDEILARRARTRDRLRGVQSARARASSAARDVQPLTVGE
jgi:hypothetical protein